MEHLSTFNGAVAWQWDGEFKLKKYVLQNDVHDLKIRQFKKNCSISSILSYFIMAQNWFQFI